MSNKPITQVLGDGLTSQVSGRGRLCCEEAQLTANELARRNEELAEAQGEIAAKAEALRAAHGSRDYWIDLYGELHDELAKMESAITELEPAEGWPDWLGPRIDPDDFEVTRDAEGNYRLECHTFAGKETTPDDLRNGWAGGGVRDKAKREAVARFIESEQADEDQRVEEQAKALYEATGVDPEFNTWAQMIERHKDHFRAAIRAGWAPPNNPV